MAKEKKQDRKPEDFSKKVDQDSKTQSSAGAQKKNNLQSTKNASEENKPGSEQQTKSASIDASQMNVAQIFQAMQSIWKKPEELSQQRENVKVRIDLVVETIKKLRAANKPIPSVNKRTNTLDTTSPQITPDERKLNDLKIVAFETEHVNLLEIDQKLWEQFVRACGSQMKALQYEKLLSQAKSKRYHNTAGYFIKQSILKTLNAIIRSDKKSTLADLRLLADHASGENLKQFNEGMRDLLDVFDDHLVIRCSHYNRELYNNIIRLTIIKWNPEADPKIEKLVIPNDSE